MSDTTIQKIITGTCDTDKIEYARITHFRYNQCPSNLLITLPDKTQVHKTLYKAFEQMQNAALNDNIKLMIFSGYRSVSEQKEIFVKKFTDKLNPNENEFIARLKFSAPSGYSEHHTGLAIDINSVEDDFAYTVEYQWLKKNAPKFGFENSFPQNNKQGLGFEPWHWRFIADDYSKKIFERARNL